MLEFIAVYCTFFYGGCVSYLAGWCALREMMAGLMVRVLFDVWIGIKKKMLGLGASFFVFVFVFVFVPRLLGGFFIER